MKVSVDQMKCRGAGMCVKIVPEVFRFQEGSKKATVLLDPVPKTFYEKCRRAALECPNSAVILEE